MTRPSRRRSVATAFDDESETHKDSSTGVQLTPTRPPAKRPRHQHRTADNDDKENAHGATAVTHTHTAKEWTAQSLATVKSCIAARLGQACVTAETGALVGLDEVFDNVYAKLESTVRDRESNSALIYGQHGVGKTQLVDKALRQLATRYSGTPYRVVQLHGLIHSDERLTLRAIAQCLGADDSEPDDYAAGASFSERFLHLFDRLKQANHQQQETPIIFILNDFELFLQQNRQVLVYNLFDAVQSGPLPLSVIGVTCCVDVVDMLEKRVRSRFSGVQFYVPPVRTVDDFVRVVRDAVCVKKGECGTVDSGLLLEFNRRVDNMLADATVTRLMTAMFRVSRKIRTAFNCMLEAVLKLSVESPYLSAACVYDCSVRQMRDCKSELLQGLSLHEFSLIIAMSRMTSQDVPVFNFEMLFETYNEFAATNLMACRKSVALKALDRLRRLELVASVDNVSKCPREFRMMRLLVESAQVIESAMKSDVLPYRVKRWAAAED